MKSCNVSRKKHDGYVVDTGMARSGLYRYTVDELTELEAKDLVCHLMDCVDAIRGAHETATWRCDQILRKHNFPTHH